MTVLHSGTTKKYSEKWDNIFGDAKPKKKAVASKKKAAASKKKKAKKKA
ncbi:MAG: hypothetical protein H6821_09465 [Planctomycetaceae bacterium]|nr:hypothetical protein [Planctomycetales bacterium]MCB9874392.1 hypothetical protein [Planctomycetaceae bacterium]